MNEFETLGLAEPILRAVKDLGFSTPTPIQQQAIPILLNGDTDLVGLAQTGTGKTAAFGLPLLHQIDFTKRDTQAIVLCPTRELCLQITKDLQSYAKYISNAKIIPIYGGVSIDKQIRELNTGAHIVVGTPGRTIDMMERGKLKLDKVNVVVLDEADEMLNMGFKEDIDTILATTPDSKLTWLFSATMPAEVARIAKNYMNNPKEISVGAKNSGATNISHEYYVVHERDRYKALKRIIDFYPDIFGIIFCRTKNDTQLIAEHLMKDGYNADALHGDLSQAQRDKVMARFRSKNLQILIATDVAARGIDVDNVTHVIHYSLPEDVENYTHRSGRTARAGKSGTSIAIINTREVGKIAQIERIIKSKFERKQVPTGVQVCEKQLYHLINKIHETEVDENEIAAYLDKAYQEFSDLSKEELIKKVISLEFNRFLSYYKNAQDLNNVDTTRLKGSSGKESYSGSRDQNNARLFFNIGEMDKLNAGALLRIICDSTGITKDAIGRIDIKGNFSFVNVNPEVSQLVIDALSNQEYNGRQIRVEQSEEKGGGGGGFRSRSGGGGYGNSRSGGGSSSKGSYGRSKSYSSKGDSGSRGSRLRKEGGFKKTKRY
ncbi:MAG: DEAD/DEAH box helicase [Bacteroidia bacterium]